jgi:DNA polymerase elongation subunit (family B)
VNKDPTGHEPYFITDQPKELLVRNTELIEATKRKRVKIRSVKKRVPLLTDDHLIKMSKIYTKTPIDVRDAREQVQKYWEGDILYHRNWIYDTQIVPGLSYYYTPNSLVLATKSEILDSPKINIPQSVLNMLKPYKGLLDLYMPVFSTPIPHLKTCGVDIETDHPKNRVPLGDKADYKIICICLVGTDGKQFAFILDRGSESMEEYQKNWGLRNKELPASVVIKRYTNEVELLLDFFDQLKKYPVVVGYNSDLFDFTYIYFRCLKLEIDKKLIPILYNKKEKICNIKNMIHIDLFSWYSNPSIQGYAHKGAYKKKNLDAVAMALLGVGKIQINQRIGDLPIFDLIYYCWIDTKRTLELFTYDDYSPLTLMIILSRVTRTGLEDLVRHKISNWIQNLFYFEHRRRNILIPRKEEIEAKGTKATYEGVIKGTKFKGAYVINPVPGIHFNVTVLDFSSLYPSIIKEYNLSYETTNCPHDACKENKIPNTPHWFCGKKRGIIAEIVSFIRDVRVFWLKQEAKKDIPEQKLFSILEQAFKVLINASWGVLGSEHFIFYCLPSAEAITAVGRYSIIETEKKAEELDVKVIYGDSITGDQPVIIKDENDEIDVIPIEELVNWSNNNIERVIPNNNPKVWSKDRWLSIDYIKRHITNKKIFRVNTHTGVCNATEDHSFFTEHKHLISPLTMKINDKLLHGELPSNQNENNKISPDLAWVFGFFMADGSTGKYGKSGRCGKKSTIKYQWKISKLKRDMLEKAKTILERDTPYEYSIYDTRKSSQVFNLVSHPIKPMYEWFRPIFYTKRRLKKVPKIILNSSQEVKKAFLRGVLESDGVKDFNTYRIDSNSATATQGMYLIAKELGFNISINTRKDKHTICRLNITNSKQRKDPIAIKHIYQISPPNNDKYVYDIATRNKKFSAGVGQLVVHNTDSVFLLNPSQEQIDEIIRWSEDVLEFPLEAEKTYRYMVLSERKKNYFGVFADGTPDIKGLTGKKRHIPIFIKRVFQNVIYILTLIKTPEDFQGAKKTIISTIRKAYRKLESKDIPIEELVFDMQITKNLNEYQMASQHVKAAKLLLKYQIRDNIKVGDIISFIKTGSSHGGGVMPLELAKPSMIHVKTYKKQLDSVLSQIIESLDITPEEIKGIVSIDKFF